MSIDKTLTQLEDDDWGEAAPEEKSYIVRSILGLRHKRLRELDVEDLRMAIQQDIGLRYLMPLALKELERNPLAEGMHYPGDLLCAVLRASPKFYKGNPDLKRKVEIILERVLSGIQMWDENEIVQEAINEAALEFKAGDQMSH